MPTVTIVAMPWRSAQTARGSFSQNPSSSIRKTVSWSMESEIKDLVVRLPKTQTQRKDSWEIAAKISKNQEYWCVMFAEDSLGSPVCLFIRKNAKSSSTTKKKRNLFWSANPSLSSHSTRENGLMSYLRMLTDGTTILLKTTIGLQMTFIAPSRCRLAPSVGESSSNNHCRSI